MNNSLSLIRKLVEDFRANEGAFLAPSYQESQVRQDFIDKFFTALGWDVTHERQKNPYEQEVKIETNVKTSGSQRRADYAFFIAPNFRDVKFFVEAKKPSRNLANLDDYYQTIRYGWNSNTPIAVLTDFEEFHVLDCRFKPDRDTALDRKIEVFRYTDYANEGTFARIFYLFGREAAANGSIEKFAAGLPKPRGKAVQKGLFKGGYQQVDEAFLVALDGYRNTLAHTFKTKNSDLTGEELTEAVQRTLDRLVFIRFLEDKQIEDPTIIDFPSKASAWKSFVAYCKSLEPKYNGLIFKPHRIIDSSDFVPPDDSQFADICDELANPTSPYDFDKIPISILGSIYERFLGKVVVATEKRVRVEEKAEVRKAGGVYYTPEYIVRYIVKETVGKMIEGKTPEQIAKMAFADIACGSGSFLLEVYDTLLEYHRKWYNANPAKAKKADVEQRDGQLVLTLKKRQEILTNNIYGVDIDFQATEVTQLSLYLKLLEDVTLTQLSFFKEKVLPNLSRNIICGNSLIEPDILESQSSLFVGAYDNTPSHADHLKPMRFTDAFPDVMARGGFDAIVGNPPYVRQEELGEQFKKYAQKSYSVFAGTADLYAYFFERAHGLLKVGNGHFGMICSNKFMRSNYGRALREFLAKRTTLLKIVDFGELPVFANASTFPAIFLTRNGGTATQEFVYAPIKRLHFESLQNEIEAGKVVLDSKSISGDNWSLSNKGELAVHDKIKAAGIELSKYAKQEIYRGIITGLTEAFVIDGDIRQRLISEDEKNVELIKPFAVGDDVRKYAINSRNRYLILIPKGWTKANMGKEKNPWEWFQKTYKSLAKYLSQFEQKAKKRQDKGDYWWELRACDYYDKFEVPKIVYPDIAKESRIAFDTKGLFLANTIYFIPTDDLYLLALLNSKLMFSYYKRVAAVLGDADKGGRLRWFRQDVLKLPIRTIKFSDPADKQRHDHIVKLVEQMLAAKEKLAKTKTDAESTRLEMQCESLDRHIDAAVYELYGLTEEEIRIVEGNP